MSRYYKAETREVRDDVIMRHTDAIKSRRKAGRSKSFAASMLKLEDIRTMSRRQQRSITAKVMVIVSIPLGVLLALVAGHMWHAVQQVRAGDRVMMTMQEVTQLSRLFHLLQRERIASAKLLWMERDLDRRHAIEERIHQTDLQLQRHKHNWAPPTRIYTALSDVRITNFDTFRQKLVDIRSSVLKHSDTAFKDMEGYHDLIGFLTYAMVDKLASVHGIVGIWNHIVAKESIIKCEMYSGLALSLGLAYHLKCNLTSQEYREFLKYDALSEEALLIVLTHEHFHERLHSKMKDSFQRMREELVSALAQNQSQAHCSEAHAMAYVRDMSEFVTSLSNMTLNVGETISRAIEVNKRDALMEMVVTLVAAVVLLVVAPVLIVSIRTIVASLYKSSKECERKSKQLEEEKERADALLFEMLPREVASKLVRHEQVVPENFEQATVFFSDVVEFMSISSVSSPLEIVALLNELYSRFDRIIEQYHVYKVKNNLELIFFQLLIIHICLRDVCAGGNSGRCVHGV